MRPTKLHDCVEALWWGWSCQHNSEVDEQPSNHNLFRQLFLYWPLRAKGQVMARRLWLRDSLLRFQSHCLSGLVCTNHFGQVLLDCQKEIRTQYWSVYNFAGQYWVWTALLVYDLQNARRNVATSLPWSDIWPCHNESGGLYKRLSLWRSV
jgi:hypothetical protein